VGFKSPQFDGSILKAVGEAVDKGVIGLVALTVVAKDKKGEVTDAGIVDDGNELVAFANKYKADSKVITKDDIEEVGSLLENDSAAGLLIVEQLWAKPLKQAILNANGFLIAEGRIHPEAAMDIEKGEN
jgi:hypothetical protein